MQSLPIDNVPAKARTATTYAAAVLYSLAREEQVGRRPRRLLEEGLATWSRFKGWLGPRDFLELLLEDAMTTQPVPFDADSILESERSLEVVPQARVGDWLGSLSQLELELDGGDYVTAQARRLGLPTRLAKSDLHKVKPHHRVLELPGSGGQLAHHMVSSQDDIYLQDVFTIACGSWREVTLAGIVAVELGLTGPSPVLLDPKLEAVMERREEFDYVVGLAKDKGGDFGAEYLRERFPHATVLLV